METWKDIAGYEGRYQVSSTGRVRSNAYKTPKLLKPFATNRGYVLVELWKKGYDKGTKYLIHRLVALAFLPANSSKPHVNHINCIKTDNRLENLEWCSALENNLHAIENKLRGKRTVFPINQNRKLTQDQVGIIRTQHASGTSRSDLARTYNVSDTTIGRILSGKHYTKF